MKTKEIAITLPFVAAGYDVLFLRGGRRRLLLLPLAATALLVPASLAGGRGIGGALDDASRIIGETRHISAWTYLLTQTRVVVTYLRLLALPVRQNLDYDFRLSTSLADPAVWGASALLLAVFGGAVLLLVRARTTNRATGLVASSGIAWFFVTLSVESSVIPIRDVIFEHRMYLPLAGASVALGAALLSAAERLRVPVAVALLAAAAPLAGATYARNLVWRDEVTLWSDVVAKSPGKARPRLNLGTAYATAGRYEDASRELREAVRLAPGRKDLHLNLGAVYRVMGRTEDAVRECREAVRLDPGYALGHRGLGAALAAAGELDRAVDAYREAVRLAPGWAEGHQDLGFAHHARGELDDAIREYREAIRLDPEVAAVHADLGAALAAAGLLEEAAREHRVAARLDRSSVGQRERPAASNPR